MSVDQVIGTLAVMTVANAVIIAMETSMHATALEIHTLCGITAVLGLITILGVVYVWVTKHRIVGE
jgi:hypothetical protein